MAVAALFVSGAIGIALGDSLYLAALHASARGGP